MAPATIPPAAQIPSLTDSAQISPILLRLLECPISLLPTLSTQTLAALQDLPQEDKPTSYEGLLDIARFCVEEEPGWEDQERAKLIGGHPRIGRQAGAISETSKKEQGAGVQEAEEVLNRLDKLNFLYERRFPTLRFVTYVAGRPKAAVADELETLLGTSIVNLAPTDATLRPDDVLASWTGFPEVHTLPLGSKEWIVELRRGEEALWEIAGDRAAKLTREIEENGSISIDIDPPQKTAGGKEGADADVDADASSSSFDVPFLSQGTFRALIFASPLLHTFFETDLPQSFLLQPVERHTSTKDALLSVFNDVTAGPSSSVGSGSMVGGILPAPRQTGITRDRVKGLLGGLLGEVADAVGTRFQQQTISGPLPSFHRRGTGGAGRVTTLEEGARGAAGGKMGLVSPAALSHRMDRASLSSIGGGATAAAAAGGGTGAKEKEEDSAAEAIRLAQEALSQRDTNQFVIDAPGEGDGDDTVEAEGREGEEEELDQDLVTGGDETGLAGPGRVTGKEAQLAKDLRSAEVQ